MNSFSGASGKSQKGSSSLNNFDFDLGLGSNRNTSRPLRDQKNPATTATTATTFSSSSWIPNKTSWTQQPASTAPPRSGLFNPTSMAGDISGKSWTSTAPATSLGIPKADPNLFGDLLGSALGQGKGSGNVPLKAAPPRNSYSMGNLADSLPKTTAAASPVKPTSWGPVDNLGSYSSQAGSHATNRTGNPLGGFPPMNKVGNSLGGPPLKSAGVAANPRTDPFGSLMDFRSNPPTKSAPPLSSNSNRSSSGDNSFGAFQNSSSSVPDNFGSFQNASSSKMEDFGMPAAQNFAFEKQQPSQPKVGADPLDMLFSSGSSAPTPAASASSEPFAEANDWDFGSEFGGNDAGGGTTTELEGLPPPPSGVTVSVAKAKGLDNHKQGQYADAIKWLSWAVKLLEKSPDSSATTEVLSCRASCYKEVGEYKKAIADCSEVLEHDNSNVTILLQRALLYESSEKYKLGAEDLRSVLKIDPSNRLARSTIHRLTQLSG